jgi:hypothetical protein
LASDSIEVSRVAEIMQEMRRLATTTSAADDLESCSSASGSACGSCAEISSPRHRKVGGMSIHEQIHVRDTRREQRLKKMKERQFDQPTLHQLFRIFDSSNSNLLSLSDFQTGLIALGFREAEGKIKGC